HGVPDHPAFGAHGEPLQVPAAHEVLPRFGFGPPPVVFQCLDDPGHLGRGGHVHAHDPAGHERVRSGVDVLPRGEHVEHDPVDARVFVSGCDVGDVADVTL